LQDVFDVSRAQDGCGLAGVGQLYEHGDSIPVERRRLPTPVFFAKWQQKIAKISIPCTHQSFFIPTSHNPFQKRPESGMPSQCALVWFKRDLRVQDHAALVAAQSHPRALAVFVVEPEWLNSPECDASHVDFALACLAELRAALAQRGMPLLVRVGSCVAVLAQLHANVGFTHLLSHEETGPGWSYTRDLQVAAWCQSQSVQWQEFTQTGVIRRLRDRAGWAQRWQARMDAPLQRLGGGFIAAAPLDQPDLPTLGDLGLAPHGKHLQAAGEKAARRTLKSFLQVRGYDYRKALSSPLTAEDGCSRLSPHLAFGTLSLRTVHQATEVAIATTPDRALAYALRGFAGRLRWHCHFMQKLEDEPEIEFRNFARVCDGLRENAFNGDYFAAWCEGRTGYPMVDACMRSLVATGWLNFRMRAMLVSFASYHLWLHWRQPGLFLARQFLDFEPGIHWSQMQMQSGTTGINTLRIYSPTKQAQDQDPQGQFIRRWVPELAKVPLPFLAEPWTMDSSVQHLAGCQIGVDYPAPIVDEKLALRAAKDRMYGLRNTDPARAEAAHVQAKHGSRKSGLPNTSQPKRRKPAVAVPSPQIDLFS
jgi:deoxyribodipyrimidine photo-lyase